MRQVTRVGEPSFVTAVTLFGLAETVRARERIRRAGAAGTGRGVPPLLCWLGIPVAHWVTSGLKAVFGRLRPYEQYPSLGIHQPGDLGASFPSGHAAAAFALAAALGYRWPQWRPVWFLMAGLVGLSRVALGMHWPSDVAAGAALGFLVVFGLAKLEKNLKREERGG